MSHVFLADSVDTSLASLGYYVVLQQMRCFSEVHDQRASREKRA